MGDGGTAEHVPHRLPAGTEEGSLPGHRDGPGTPERASLPVAMAQWSVPRVYQPPPVPREPAAGSDPRAQLPLSTHGPIATHWSHTQASRPSRGRFSESFTQGISCAFLADTRSFTPFLGTDISADGPHNKFRTGGESRAHTRLVTAPLPVPRCTQG